jgi:uncharacterized glyoxalase superfamily protein PhnB
MEHSRPVRFLGLTPYIYYDDADKMADWLARSFGFIEKGRHLAEDGTVRNVEMTAGPSELWLDGYRGHGTRPTHPPAWIGVWVDDVNAVYERVHRLEIDAAPPEDKPYGVRMLNVKDPEGVTWGFMARL